MCQTQIIDEAVRVTKDLLIAIKKLQSQEAAQLGRHVNALKKLSEIFQGKMINLDTRGREEPKITSSPTKPENLIKTPRVHSRVTRINTPGIIPEKPVQVQSEGEHKNKYSQ